MSLDGLNPPQREAVRHREGPLLVLAGAGTGKTRVITHRLAELIRGGTPADRTLSVTFTNKAAKEMRERASALLHPGRKRRRGEAAPVISTFHALCLRILRQETANLGLPERFAIFDRGDQESAARGVLREVKLADGALKPGDLLARISKWKTAGLSPKEAVGAVEDDRDFLAAVAYRKYAEKLQAEGGVDFDDLLLLVLRLFRERPDRLAYHAGRFDFVQVDEYQDTNGVQFGVLKALVDGHRNLCVVGDDDQSIYGWRGADVEHILHFASHFPGAKVIRLEENYRCAAPVIEWSNRLVTFNKARHDKTLTPARRVTNPVKVTPYQDADVEAEQVVLEIDFLTKQRGVNPGDIAILHRTADQTRPFEEHLRKRQIPYEVVGGQSFFDRKEVKDVMALLRAVESERDDRALLRIVNVPPRGIGQTTVKDTLDEAVRTGASFWQAAEARIGRGEINPKTAAALRDFRALLAEFRRKLASARDLSAVAANLLERVDYEAEIDRRYDNPQERIARSGGVEAVLDSLRNYCAEAKAPTLSGYLQETTLGEREVEDKKPDGPGKAVVLMTLHSAKGLEFPRVYLVGLEEGVLPHKRSVELGTRAAMEEERRLCYVGLTRARDYLTLSYCLGRRSRGRVRPCHPSRFLAEMSGKQWPGPPKEERKPKPFVPRRAKGSGRSARVTHTRNRR
ncbi:ATP-dependent helicase [Alienimonas sp. DA493]|uniref:ATP-dependent helicase n=1 Tax=Alienimonas sp. DA493 TaxID=3373605 RepID=UPI003754BF92